MQRLQEDHVETLKAGHGEDESPKPTNNESMKEKDHKEPQAIEHSKNPVSPRATGKDLPIPENEAFEWGEVKRGFQDPQVRREIIVYMAVKLSCH